MNSIEQVKERFVSRLYHLLRHPSMFVTCDADLEIQLRTVIDDLHFINGARFNHESFIDKLVSEGVYCPRNSVAGVSNVFRNLMPDTTSFKDEVASVYAKNIYQLGYLKIESTLSISEFENLIQRIIWGEFCQAFTPLKLNEKLPVPSFKVGNTKCFVSEDVNVGWIYFDFRTDFDNGIRSDYLQSIRWPAETFEKGFELTREGYRKTRKGIANPKCDMDAMIQEWQKGKKWAVNEPFPVIEEKPRSSRWAHLWSD